MSGTYPTAPVFSSLNFESQQKTIVTTTDSGKMFSTQIDGQRFKFSASYAPMSRTNFSPIIAFIMKQRSQQSTFQISLPDIKDAKGTISGTVLVNAAHSAGDTTIAVDAMTGSLLAGDFVKFNSHTKVYMIVEDVTASVGAATLTIEPPLREALLNNEAVTYDGVQFTVRLTNDMQKFKTKEIDKYVYELDFIEAI